MNFGGVEKNFFALSQRSRWLIIITTFFIIVFLDFSTPPQYILAYLYTVPILFSVSLLKPEIAKKLLLLAVLATLLNLIFPHNVANVPSILVNRLLSVFAIITSAFFMVRYVRYQEQVKQQESLLASERKLSQIREDFIATLTHDLKTPLLGEQKTLHYLAEEAFGSINEEQREAILALERSTQRQLELVENLLAVYRQDNTGVELRLALLDLDELIADILTEVQALANERSIKLDYICRRTPPKVYGDGLQLKRVLANLIHNALNYTPAGKAITVNVLEQPHELTVEVIDSGPGLSEEDVQNIFSRFYRAEGSRHIIGTGLGLYLSQQLITAHRGRIWAESVKPRGCKFSFTVPTITTEVPA
jgi:two-component system NarL family sensor kinase